MSATKGSLSVPAPEKTSQLTNDSRYLSVIEYVLSETNLKSKTSLTISDLPTGSIIQEIEVRVTTPFTPTTTQYNLAISGSNGAVLMSANCNDPNTAGVYHTDCYYEVTSTVVITHNMNNITAGSAIVRFFVYAVES